MFSNSYQIAYKFFVVVFNKKIFQSTVKEGYVKCSLVGQFQMQTVFNSQTE